MEESRLYGWLYVYHLKSAKFECLQLLLLLQLLNVTFKTVDVLMSVSQTGIKGHNRMSVYSMAVGAIIQGFPAQAAYRAQKVLGFHPSSWGVLWSSLVPLWKWIVQKTSSMSPWGLCHTEERRCSYRWQNRQQTRQRPVGTLWEGMWASGDKNASVQDKFWHREIMILKSLTLYLHSECCLYLLMIWLNQWKKYIYIFKLRLHKYSNIIP